MRASHWVALLAALSAWPCLASFEGRPVVEVEFYPPRQPLLSTHLEQVVHVEQGKPLKQEQVRRSIHDLFATGRYNNVEVEAVPEGGGVRVIFWTLPSWFIGVVEVTGAPSPRLADELANAANLDLGQLFTAQRAGLAQERVRRTLYENGFYEAVVGRTEIEHPETQQKDVIFEVQPGPRAGIGRLYLAGGSGWDEEQVREVAGWKRGKPFTQKRIRQGVERIKKAFHQENFWRADVRIGGHDYNPDAKEVNLVLRIEKGPAIFASAEGHDFSQEQLQRYLPIYEEGAVDPDLLAEGAENLRNYLQTKGYFSARVDYEVDRNPNEKVEVLYTVERSPRQELAYVEITGNRYFDLETLTERMLIREESLQFRHGRFSQSLLEADLEAFRELYRSNGFQDVQINTRLEEDYQGKRGKLAVFIEIQEGPQTFVEDVRIEGVDYFEKQEFLSRLASAPGQPFSESNVATDRDLILADYFNSGFRDASFAWQQHPGEEPNTVVLDYRIQEGEPLFVRRPIVMGLRNTASDVVRQQVQIVPGEPFSQEAMFETQRRLYNLGVFSKVDVGVQNPQGDEPSKNILLQLEEARRWAIRYGGGAEFARIGGNTANLSSPVGEGSFSPRLTFELTRLNVRGMGHTMTARTRISNLQQRALFTYEAPRWQGSDDWRLTLSGLFDSSENVRTFSRTRFEGALQLRQRINKASNVLYRYIYRRTTLDDDTLQIRPELIPQESQPVRVGLLAATYIQDRRDDPIDATRGIFSTVDVSQASGAWGSQPDFFRLLAQNATYHRLSSRVVLARILRVGAMVPTTSRDPGLPAPSGPLETISQPDNRIPLSERFFGGGANSHRGFPINQAGPRDPATGFPVGGGALLINTLELRFPILGENIGGVLFHDAGNVYSEFSGISFSPSQDPIFIDGQLAGYDFDYLVNAVGMGLRYKTPIGPLRLDLAYSINPPRFIGFEGTREQLLAGQGTITRQRIDNFQFHFSLGQTF